MGPMGLIEQYGEDASVLIQTCTAGILYDAMQTRNTDYASVMKEVCGLTEEEALYQKVADSKVRLCRVAGF